MLHTCNGRTIMLRDGSPTQDGDATRVTWFCTRQPAIRSIEQPDRLMTIRLPAEATSRSALRNRTLCSYGSGRTAAQGSATVARYVRHEIGAEELTASFHLRDDMDSHRPGTASRRRRAELGRSTWVHRRQVQDRGCRSNIGHGVWRRDVDGETCFEG
jgi:hypothetical protein